MKSHFKTAFNYQKMLPVLVFILNLPVSLPILLASLLVLKLIIFNKYRTQSWRLTHFFYFDPNHIRGSRNTHTQSAKKIQNILSQVILALSILTLIVIIAYRVADLS